MRQVTYSVFCGLCEGHCAALATVENGKIIKWRADKESGLPYRPCPSFKGQAWKEINEHPDRLKYPLKRAGAKGEGKWHRISWDEALESISRKLTKIREEYGPTFLGAGVGEPVQLEFVWLERFMSAFRSPNICTPFGVCGANRFASNSAMWGTHHGVSPRADQREDIHIDPLLIIWARTMGDFLGHDYDRIKKHVEEGGKLVIINPKKQRVVKWADLWLKPRPGSDGALAMGLLKIVIDEKLYDEEFVDKWTVGFDKICKEISAFTLDDVERETWIPKEQIQQLARWMGEYKITAFGSSRFLVPSGIYGIHAQNVLNTIIDPNNIPGWGWSSERQFKQWSGRALYLLDKFPRTAEGNVGAQYRYGLRTAYIPYQALVNGILDDKIKAALMVQCNPIITYPNSRKVYDAFKRLDLFVSLEVFPTPTSSLADYVLPVATINEIDTVRASTGGDSLLAYPKIVDPPGEARSDVMIINDLAKKLGLGEYFFDSDIETLNYVLQPSGFTWEEFKKIRLNITKFTPKTEGGDFFTTPSGKAEFHSNKAKEKLGIDMIPTWQSVTNYPKTSEEYPMLMTSYKDEQFRLSGWKHVKYFRKRKPHPTVHINPEVAQKTGSVDGDWIWIETDTGKIMQKVVIDPDIDPRVALLSWGWWFPEAGGATSFGWDKSNVNILLPDEPADPVTGQTILRGYPCRVYKAEHGEVGIPDFVQA